jgi:hypothetical protein
MSEERKEELDISSAEFRVDFNTDEGYREQRGVSMSVVGPGPGNQRAVLEGELGGVRNRLLRGETTVEQTFRSSALKYLEGAYRSMEIRQRQSIVDQALMVVNYSNLFLKLLVAAVYFRQRAPQLRNRAGLSLALLSEHASVVLAPLLADTEARKVRQKKVTREMYLTQLQADLLRYLRYILPA